MIERQCKRHREKLKQFVKLQITIIVVIMLCSCGNKGDLYLPDETNETVAMQEKLTDHLAQQVALEAQPAFDELTRHAHLIKPTKADSGD